MESDRLYKVKKEDFGKLEQLLTRCFIEDPLYCQLIPDHQMREKLLPELFDCDLTEFYENCEIFADSEEMRGILVVSDERSPIQYFQIFSDGGPGLPADGWISHQGDPSLKTFWNFFVGRDYLNSRWTAQLHQQQRLHIIYLAVDPKAQHHGVADLLLHEVIRYSEENRMMISLETHNEKNVAMYEHFGFKVFGIVEKHFPLKQYCLIREIQAEV